MVPFVWGCDLKTSDLLMVTNGLEIADAFFIVVIAYLEKRLLRETANYEDQSHLC